MRRIILDGRELTSKEKLHSVLKEALNLPDYYGNNLDALHDCLTQMPGIELQLRYAPAMLNQLDAYGESFIALLELVQKERTDFCFKLIQS